MQVAGVSAKGPAPLRPTLRQQATSALPQAASMTLHSSLAESYVHVLQCWGSDLSTPRSGHLDGGVSAACPSFFCRLSR